MQRREDSSCSAVDRQTDAHASARSDFDYGGDFVTGGREGEAEAERETTQSGEESVRVEWGQATFLSAVKMGGAREL